MNKKINNLHFIVKTNLNKVGSGQRKGIQVYIINIVDIAYLQIQLKNVTFYPKNALICDLNK